MITTKCRITCEEEKASAKRDGTPANRKKTPQKRETAQKSKKRPFIKIQAHTRGITFLCVLNSYEDVSPQS